MEININIDNYRHLRFNFFKWRYETKYVYKLFLALGFALLTAIFAQVRFYLPGNSLVPITGQTFAVLLAGVLLGRWGGISQCIYVGIGFMGVPWFASVTGSTFGYLFGFILSAFFLGFMTERYIKSRNFSRILPLMLFTDFVLILIPGAIVLYYWWNSFIGSIGFIEIVSIAILPFIIGDILKAITAAVVAKVILPKKAYGPEFCI